MHRGPSRPRCYCRTDATRENASRDAHGPLGFASVEGGIYVTFFEPGEPFERELPPVGPLDHVVVRQDRLVADRRHAEHEHLAGRDVVKALHAEVELQRAPGQEPGGPKRTQMRMTAPDGVYLRFVAFGQEEGRDVSPERGPFAIVIVSKDAVEGDGQALATRATDDSRAWDVAADAALRIPGLRRADIAMRTASTEYHPRAVRLSTIDSVRPRRSEAMAPVSWQPMPEPTAPAPHDASSA